MAVHEIALRRREPVAEGTAAFYFDKPAGFVHQAGQNALFTLVDPPETDAEGPSRTFTIASAPHEPELMIATRMRDTAFKRVLKSAALGTPVRIDGPSGAMVLHEDAAFFDELRALERSHPSYRLIAAMSEPEKSSQPWKGETGFIRPDILERHLTDLKSPVYYFAGPPGMTMAMQSMLEGLGVDENDMRSEEFYGY